MQVITTKFMNVTNSRPRRIKAMASAGSKILSVDADSYNEHRRVALALQAEMGWSYPMVGGEDRSGNYQWLMLHSGRAEHDIERSGKAAVSTAKYRPYLIERVLDTPTLERGTLEITLGSKSRTLSVERGELAALLDLFNQID